MEINWHPVETLKNQSDVISGKSIPDDVDCSILGQVRFRGKGVVIINTGSDLEIKKNSGGGWCKEWTKTVNVAY